MRGRLVVFVLALLSAVCQPAVPVQAQDLPPECKEAMELRSPGAQVEQFSRCLESGRLSGGAKATTYKQRAVSYMHLGQHQRAIDDLNEAIRIKPDDADNYYLRGVAYRGLQQHQKSVEDSTRAIGMDPNFAAAYANRAFSYKALGNEGQARSDARRAQDLDPRVKVPWF